MSSLGKAVATKQANAIYSLVNEAYRVLKDPEQHGSTTAARRRNHPDDRRRPLRCLRPEACQRSGQRRQAPQGREILEHGSLDWEQKSYRACVMNIQFALNFEPNNEVFKEWLDKAKAARDEDESKREKNPYKLRLM